MTTGHCTVCGASFPFDAFTSDVDAISTTGTVGSPTDAEKLEIVDTTAGLDVRI